MKVSLLITLGFLAPSITASTHHAATSQPIFVLKTTQTATSSLSKALSKLGFIHQDTRQANSSVISNAIANTNTYVEVTSDTQLLEITESHPEAKFIIPSGSRFPTVGEGNWLAQASLSDKNLNGILELDVLALEKGTQAENWVRLCDFLGMGYSIVERLGLWHFPQ
ncbi:hypothetical protein F5Y02DRAFT_418611 [Annulohypoxylon stygium]|nr:hypothetical protein F5Y02DRAFT_418611 [Annulohypoxylon stygium]